MPALIRMYIRNVAIGAALAVLFTGLLIWMNVANLQHLITEVRGGWVAVIMLIVFHTILFGGVQFAIAVMSMAEDDTPRGGLRQHLLTRLATPAPVPARAASSKPRPQRPGGSAKA